VQESIVVRQFLPNLSTLLTFVKYVGCFQDTVHQYLSRLYNNSTKKRQHFKHLSLWHHVSCVQKWMIWFYAVLFC